MQTYSTLQAAKKLGITDVALGRYVKLGKIPSPQTVRVGARNVHIWTDADIEHVRKLLPKIANGRKTRYQKLREKQRTQAGVPVPQGKKQTQPSAAAFPKKRRTKKKK
jgi:hypothetical protein